MTDLKAELSSIVGNADQDQIDDLAEVVHDLCAGDARLTLEEALDIVRRVYPEREVIPGDTARMTVHKMMEAKMRMQDLEGEIIDTGDVVLISAYYEAVHIFCNQIRIGLDQREAKR